MGSFLDIIEQYGIKREVAPGTKRVSWLIRCECGEELAKNWKMNMPPEKVVQFTQQAGWEVSRKHPPKCPGCIAREKQMKQENRERPTLVAVTSTPAPEPTVEPAINPKLMRQVYALLDDNFDEQTRRYKGSWSDAKVAKECGASQTFVERVRREAYGELAEDPEVVALREDLVTLRKRITQHEDAILTHVTKSLEPLRQMAEQMETRLSALESRNCN